MSAADRITELYQQQGQIGANQALQTGQIWGGAISNLGTIPQSIQQSQMLRQEQQIRQLQLDQAQRQQAAEAALNNAYSKALQPDGSINYDVLGSSLANTSAASKWPEIQKQMNEATRSHLEVSKLQTELEDKTNEALSTLAFAADVPDDAHAKAGLLLTGLAANKAIPPERKRDIIAGLLGQDGNPDPGLVTQTLAQLQQLSPSNVEKRAQAKSAAAEQRNREAQLPAIQAEADIKRQIAAGTVGGLTPDQQADNARAAAAQAATERNQQLTRDQEAQRIALERRRVELEGQRLKNETAGQQQVEIKPNTPEFRIAQDLASGKMTFSQFRTLAAYNRNAALKFGIYDMARQLNPEFDPAQYELGFKMASNPQIRQRVVSINALSPVINQAETLVDQVGNGDIQALNKIIQGAKLQFSNRPVANFRQMQILLGEEIGNALGLGTGSDLKTKLGIDLVNPSLSPQAFKDNLEQLRNVLDARRAELVKQMGIYGGATTGGGSAPAGTGPKILSITPVQ